MSIYTCLHTHTHTAARGWAADLIPAACARPPLPSLSLSAPSGSSKRHKGCFVVSLSFPSTSPVQQLSAGHLAWPVHLYRCWWIETLSCLFVFLVLHSLLHVFIKKNLSLSFSQSTLFVSWNSGRTVFKYLLGSMQHTLFIPFVG